VRRTQLYLDDELWKALHDRAASEKTTISELVRQAARERYLPDREKRRQAMMAFAGIRKERTDFEATPEFVRKLRNDDGRMKRLMKQWGR
jgi:hypothetical protein